MSGGDAGHVQSVSGGDGPAGLLQVERGHLCFYWPTLELPAGNKVTVTFISPVVTCLTSRSTLLSLYLLTDLVFNVNKNQEMSDLSSLLMLENSSLL